MAALDSKCSGYGFQQGTTAFSNCLMQQDTLQNLEQRANEAAKKRQNFDAYNVCLATNPNPNAYCAKWQFCGLFNEKC